MSRLASAGDGAKIAIKQGSRRTGSWRLMCWSRMPGTWLGCRTNSPRNSCRAKSLRKSRWCCGGPQKAAWSPSTSDAITNACRCRKVDSSKAVYSSAPITACATMRLVSASGYRRTPTATSCKELGCARFRSSSKTVSSGSGRESQGGDGPAAAHSGDRRSGMGNGRHRADAGARQHCVADRKPARHQPFLPAARRQYRR